MEEYVVNLTEAQIVMLAEMCESMLGNPDTDDIYNELVERLDNSLCD